MNSEFEDKIQSKSDAVRSDAFLAKRKFDSEKDAFDDLSTADDEYYPELAELRHEIKLMMALFSESK